MRSAAWFTYWIRLRSSIVMIPSAIVEATARKLWALGRAAASALPFWATAPPKIRSYQGRPIRAPAMGRTNTIATSHCMAVNPVRSPWSAIAPTRKASSTPRAPIKTQRAAARLMSRFRMGFGFRGSEGWAVEAAWFWVLGLAIPTSHEGAGFRRRKGPTARECGEHDVASIGMNDFIDCPKKFSGHLGVWPGAEFARHRWNREGIDRRCARL